MAKTLEEYFVSIGVKGQKYVLSTIDKVKKDAKSLSKVNASLDLGKGNINKAITAAGKTIPSMKQLTGQGQPTGQPSGQGQPTEQPLSPEQKKSDKEEKDNTNRFKKSADMISGAMQSFAHSSAGLNPVEFLKGITLAAGKGLSGLTFMTASIGNIPELVATLATTSLSQVTAALESGKQATAATYAQQQRNTTVDYYGGGDVKSDATAAGMSNSEYSQMIMQIVGSNGKLDKSLKSMVDELAKTKDANALGNVASGNFASTGTTKGWIMQQIMDSMGNVPPEFRQKMTKALLPQMQDEIMGNKGQGARSQAAGYANTAEAQNEKLYNISIYKTMSTANDAINEAQLTMVKAANTLATGMKGLIDNVDTLGKNLNQLGESVKNSAIGIAILGKPGIHK